MYKNGNSRKPRPTKSRKDNNKECKRDDKYVKDEDRDNKDTKYSGAVNDASYYFIDETLKNQVTSISFNQYMGNPIDLGSNVLAGAGSYIDNPSYLMTLHLNPAVNYSNGVGVDGVNLAGLANYTKLSANNAKTSQYQPHDVTMLTLALGQLIAIVSHITRIFGCTKLYNYRNRAYPKQIIEGLGINYNDLVANLANYRIQFNTLIVSISKIPIPNNIPYFMKCSELYSGLYLDMVGSSMAQTYAFVPYSTWSLDEAYNDNGSGLSTVELYTTPGATKPLSEYLLNLESMADNLLNSSTLNAIYSDILRLADKEGLQLLTFQTVSEDYTIIPQYIPEIRLWIGNATFTSVKPTGTTSTSTQTINNDVESNSDYNSVKYMPYFVPNWYQGINKIINFDYANPDNNDILYATRLMPCAYQIKGETALENLDWALPDHYPVQAGLFIVGTNAMVVGGYSNGGSTSHLAMIAKMNNFDWAPPLYIGANNGNGYTATNIDYNFYTVLNYRYLKSLHDSTYQGLFMMR